MIKKIVAIVCFAACCLPATSLKALGAPQKLSIISPHWEGIRTEFTRAFKAWHKKNGGGDVEITWLDQGGGSDDLKYIHAGFSRNPAGIGVDLFFGGGIDPYMELASAELLAPAKLPATIRNKIPKELNGVPLFDPSDKWYGASLAGFGILYNKKLLKMYRMETPKTWSDLAAPEFFDLIGSGDPRHSGSVHIMYEIILQAYGWKRGWEIILPMGANVRTFPKSSSQTSKDLAVGEVAAGLSIDTYAFSAIEETGGNRLGFILPEKATVITPDPIAMLKGAPNPALAREFIRFVLSPEGQRLWLYKKGEPGGPKEFSLNKMSVLPEMYKNYGKKSNVPVNPFTRKKGFSYDSNKGTVRWNILNDLIGALVIDTHEDLAPAWKKLSKSKNKKKFASVMRPPVSEAEVMKLAGSAWNDQVTRNKMVNEWIADARSRYRSVK
ncbi:MAG TPA: extracellular solute-binding protein [bacterium]|nr:extracellular solute-binding protein [bacterium]